MVGEEVAEGVVVVPEDVDGVEVVAAEEVSRSPRGLHWMLRREPAWFATEGYIYCLH